MANQCGHEFRGGLKKFQLSHAGGCSIFHASPDRPAILFCLSLVVGVSASRLFRIEYEMKYLARIICFAALLCFTSQANGQAVGEEFFEGTIQPSDVWDGSFAFGLNGKTGNSENLDINLDFSLNREDDIAITDILMTYFYSSNRTGTTTDRYFTQGRQERKLANPNLTWFYQAAFEWDRFKSFDYRIALHTGIGILLYEYDDRSLRARIGAGASREFGGVNDEWLPELVFGLDWERQLTERTSLFINVDYFPNVEDFADFRLNTRAGFETLLDEALDMRLRMFVFNRYDSTPGPGFQENDLDYGMALVFGF